MCAKSLFWQRFYTTESKLKGSYQQTLLKNPSLYLRGKYFHIPSASRETGRHKLPVHARTHTHLNHRLSSRLPPHTKQQQLRLKCFWGYGNPIRAGHASISTPRWSENILAKCLSTALHIPSRSHAYFWLLHRSEGDQGPSCPGSKFSPAECQKHSRYQGVEKERERETVCVSVWVCVCVCDRERLWCTHLQMGSRTQGKILHKHTFFFFNFKDENLFFNSLPYLSTNQNIPLILY